MGLIHKSEAARRLGVTSQTIANWAEKDVLEIKKIGKAHYVDEDTVAAIGTFGQSVEEIMRRLHELKRQYEQEVEDVERLRANTRFVFYDVNDRRRYMNLCVVGSIRNHFFETVTELLVYLNVLTEREANILSERLNGKSTEYISREFGLTQGRILQIIDKAIRKSGELGEVKKVLETVQNLRTDNIALKTTVKDLKLRLRVQDEEDKERERERLEELRRRAAENDALCRLFSQKLTDHPISVRALNCLKSADIETVGDLCKVSKIDLLKQRNFGKKSLYEMDDFLKDLGLQWSMDVDKMMKERVDRILLEEGNGNENYEQQ